MKTYDIDELLDMLIDKQNEIEMEYGFKVNSPQDYALNDLRDYIMVVLYGRKEYLGALNRGLIKAVKKMIEEKANEKI